MSTETNYYLKTLRSDFETRQARRPDFSLRAYARYLGVEAASLSSVLKGTRRLSKSSVTKVADRLNLSPNERETFIKSNGITVTAKLPAAPVARFELDEETHFRIISEWEHYAILSLMATPDFQSNTAWISERLGITALRAQICLENLLAANLIAKDAAGFKATHQQLATTEDVPSAALKKAREQDLELAMIAIDEVAVELRDLSSCTMTADPADLPEMKKMIRAFRQRFMKEAEKKTGTEVYKLSIQLIPLTK